VNRITHVTKCDETYASWSQDSADGIATGYGLDGRGIRSSSPGKVKDFPLDMSSRPALGPTQPPGRKVPGALSPVAKQPRLEADYSSPVSAEIKITWIYTSAPPYVFMAYYLIS
jgi:hypothetical protein